MYDDTRTAAASARNREEMACLITELTYISRKLDRLYAAQRAGIRTAKLNQQVRNLEALQAALQGAPEVLVAALSEPRAVK